MSLETLGTFEVIRAWDPAIDFWHQDCDLDSFILTRDPAFLRFLPDVLPSRYVCRELSVKIARQIRATTTNADELRVKLFQASLLRVIKPHFRPDLEEWRPAVVAEIESGTMTDAPLLVSDRELENWRGNMPTIDEVGEVAAKRAFLSCEIDVSFVAPPTSQQLLARNVVLFAALMRSRGAATRSMHERARSPHDPPAEPEEKTPSSGGADSPGDAPATGSATASEAEAATAESSGASGRSSV